MLKFLAIRWKSRSIYTPIVPIKFIFGRTELLLLVRSTGYAQKVKFTVFELDIKSSRATCWIFQL